MKLLIDGHLDLAMNALDHERDQTLPVEALRHREKGGVADDRGIATVSLPDLRRARAGLVSASLIARCKPWVDPARAIARHDLDYPHPAMAHSVAHGQLAYYRLLESQGHVRIIENQAQLDHHWQRWQSITPAPTPDAEPEPIGLILMMEGADPIVEPEHLHHWHALGLRILSLAHFGHSRYAAGTPSRDPASFEKDGPLTPLGHALLKQMQDLPLALDLTHLADTAFFQAIDACENPVCATHTNCRALAPSPRQFTDKQIKLLVERDGVIGLALAANMIRCNPAGNLPDDAGLQLKHLAEHVDHICQLAGSANHVALGTDLDGGFGAEHTPLDLQRYDDLHKLAPLLQNRGLSDDDINGFFHANWLRFYRTILPAAP